jgi:hypothetical protein
MKNDSILDFKNRLIIENLRKLNHVKLLGMV